MKEMRQAYRILIEKFERDYMKELEVDGTLKYDVKLWIGSIWRFNQLRRKKPAPWSPLTILADLLCGRTEPNLTSC